MEWGRALSETGKRLPEPSPALVDVLLLVFVQIQGYSVFNVPHVETFLAGFDDICLWLPSIAFPQPPVLHPITRRHAVSKAIDFTQGSIQKNLIAFAFPLFLGNLFQQLYNTADSLIVGNFLGSQALAAVSSSSPLINMMVGFFNGMAIGAGVIISRAFGARDSEALDKAIHTDLAFSLAAGAGMTILGSIFTPLILEWMQTPADIMPNSVAYFRVYCLGITQHRCGVNNVRSLANLSMLCGQIGRPCTGVNPLRGQNNVQGACDMGAMPTDFTGYQKVFDDAARATDKRHQAKQLFIGEKGSKHFFHRSFGFIFRRRPRHTARPPQEMGKVSVNGRYLPAPAARKMPSVPQNGHKGRAKRCNLAPENEGTPLKQDASSPRAVFVRR